MAKSINSLLRKKTWTGAEVGKAVIATFIHDTNHHTDADYKPLFTQEELELMEKGIEDKEWTIYGVYVDLYHSLISAYNSGESFIQQFNNGYYRYIHEVTTSQLSEESFTDALHTPFIVTQSQYDRYKAEVIKNYEEYPESFAGIMFHLLQDCIENPDRATDKIAAAIEATKAEPATNARILANYNKDTGNGYYVLPNGVRSDTCTEEEWQKQKNNCIFQKYSFELSRGEMPLDAVFYAYNADTVKKIYQLFYEGIEGLRKLCIAETGKDIPADLEEETLLQAMEMAVMAMKNDKAAENMKQDKYTDFILDLLEIVEKWHYYEDVPELTKYDLLADCLDRYNGAIAEDITEQEQLKEFMADYPALFKALESYIKKAIPAFKGMKPEQYCDSTITWKELADLDFMHYKSFFNVTDTDIQQLFTKATTPEEELQEYIIRARIMYGGIAVIQEPAAINLKENGDYDSRVRSSVLSIANNLFVLEDNEGKQKDIAVYRDKLALPALRYLYAFNSLVKIVSNVYNVPELEEVMKDMRLIEQQIEAFNQLVCIFYANVGGDWKTKQRKRAVIKEVFKLIDLQKLKPTIEAEQKITQELMELGFTKAARTKVRRIETYLPILMGEEV